MNNYADDLLTKVTDLGMTDGLWDTFYQDFSKIQKHNIQNDNERNLLFCIDHLLSGICKKFNIEFTDGLLQKVFNTLRKEEKPSIDKIFNTIGEIIPVIMYKKAYPNIRGVAEQNTKPQRDINKWIKTLGEIHLLKEQGYKFTDIIQNLLEGWDNMEKQDFQHWLKYYETGDHEKYKTASPLDGQVEPQPVLQPVPPLSTIQPPIQPKRIKSPQENQKALVSRLNAAERLLYDFRNVWPKDILNRLFEYLAELKRTILTLETKASMVDCIVRTASIWDKNGFPEGGAYLRKIAEESDLATQIEKALTGKEYEHKGNEAPGAEEMPGGAPIPGMEGMPGEAPATGMEGMPGETPAEMSPEMPADLNPTPPPAGAEETLPPPAELPAAPETTKPVGDKENPFAGSTVKDVVDTLEKVLKQIRERETFRELSKADMMLDSLNIASHFPELSEAVGHLLEANNYVSTRLDKMISKLKGGLDEGGNDKAKPEAPLIEMTELQPGGSTGPSVPEQPASEQPAIPEQPAEQPAAPEKPLVEVEEKR